MTGPSYGYVHPEKCPITKIVETMASIFHQNAFFLAVYCEMISKYLIEFLDSFWRKITTLIRNEYWNFQLRDISITTSTYTLKTVLHGYVIETHNVRPCEVPVLFIARKRKIFLAGLSTNRICYKRLSRSRENPTFLNNSEQLLIIITLHRFRWNHTATVSPAPLSTLTWHIICKCLMEQIEQWSWLQYC